MTTGTAQNPAANSEMPSKNTLVLLEFLYQIGQAYLTCEEQTAEVKLLVRRIATVYGMRKARVVAFPMAIFISANKDEAILGGCAAAQPDDGQGCVGAEARACCGFTDEL